MRDLLQVILPNGQGWILVYSLFCDETYRNETDQVLVAGYLIGCTALKKFLDAWSQTLKEGGLSYFHMKEGHHKSHPKTYASLANLISHDFIAEGFCASVVTREYDSVCSIKVPNHRGKPQKLSSFFGGPYTFCTGAIVDLANRWLDYQHKNERDVAYVFDAGDPRQGEAGDFFNMLLTDKLLSVRKRDLRFYSYAFVDGKRLDGGALQAADMLAWNFSLREAGGDIGKIGSQILNSVELKAVHFGEAAIKETMIGQVRFCSEEYALLRSANTIHQRPRNKQDAD